MSKILLVEDDLPIRQGYRMILERQGYEVAEAANGEQALKIVDEFKPKLILLDLMMPVMDGIEFLERYDLKKHPEVLVIVLSNSSVTEKIKKAADMGVAEYLVKAVITPADVVSMVEKILPAGEES